MQKTSIRFFDTVPVRAVWDDDTGKWWFCAMDMAEALTKSKNPRSYGNAVKRRNGELNESILFLQNVSEYDTYFD